MNTIAVPQDVVLLFFCLFCFIAVFAYNSLQELTCKINLHVCLRPFFLLEVPTLQSASGLLVRCSACQPSGEVQWCTNLKMSISVSFWVLSSWLDNFKRYITSSLNRNAWQFKLLGCWLHWVHQRNKGEGSLLSTTNWWRPFIWSNQMFWLDQILPNPQAGDDKNKD